MIYRRVIFLDTMAALVVLVAETVRKRCARRGGEGVAREDAIEGGGGEEKGWFQAEKLALYTSRYVETNVRVSCGCRTLSRLSMHNLFLSLSLSPLRIGRGEGVCNGERGSLFTYLAARK